MSRGIFEVQSGTEWFGFCLAVVEGGWESGICNAVCIVKVLLVINTGGVRSDISSRIAEHTGLWSR
jgi:hypothetical protein